MQLPRFPVVASLRPLHPACLLASPLAAPLHCHANDTTPAGGAGGSDEAKMLQMAAGMSPAMMMGGGMGGPQGWQPKTAYAAEAAALNIAQYSSQLVDAEADLLVAAAAALRR